MWAGLQEAVCAELDLRRHLRCFEAQRSVLLALFHAGYLLRFRRRSRRPPDAPRRTLVARLHVACGIRAPASPRPRAPAPGEAGAATRWLPPPAPPSSPLAPRAGSCSSRPTLGCRLRQPPWARSSIPWSCASGTSRRRILSTVFFHDATKEVWVSRTHFCVAGQPSRPLQAPQVCPARLGQVSGDQAWGLSWRPAAVTTGLGACVDWARDRSGSTEGRALFKVTAW